MTATELSYAFDVGFDSIMNFSSPGFNNREKSELLSQAEENIYLDLIDPQSVPRSSAVKEELSKIILSELVRNTGDLTPETHNTGLPTGFTNLPYGQFVFLPEDFFFPLTEFVDIEFNDTSYYYYHTDKFPSHRDSNIYVKPVSQLDFTNSYYSHIRKSYEELVLRMEYGRQDPSAKISNTNKKVYELFGSSEFSIYKYRASYYRRLKGVNIDNNTTSELDPFIHRTIVKDAIKIAAAAIDNPNKYQIANAETKQ